MDRLCFVYGDTDSIEGDFALCFDKQWNTGSIKSWYHLYALPAIAKRNRIIHLGRIWIAEPTPKTSACIVYSKSADPRIDDTDTLGKTLGYGCPFEYIPERFQSIINEDVAKNLFVLLTPFQRKCFVNSLHVCTNENEYEKGKKQMTLPRKMVKQFNSWNDRERAIPVCKYLFSDINYSILPNYN